MRAQQQPGGSVLITLETGDSLIIGDDRPGNTIKGPATFIGYPDPGLILFRALAVANVTIEPVPTSNMPAKS